MRNIASEDLKQLLETHPAPCITMFLKTHELGEKVDKDKIKLKNVLRQLDDLLDEEGIKLSDRQGLVLPVHQLLLDSRFWQSYSSGFALFLAPGFFQFYHLPGAPDLLLVSDSFYLKPLLPHSMQNHHFFLLALTLNHVDLYEGSQEGLKRLQLPPGTPRTIEEALMDEDLEQHLQHHTAAPAGQGKIAGIFHGQASDSDNPPQRLFNFYNRVDHGLHPFLRNQTAPLILAGVEKTLPTFRRANSYHNLVEEGVLGNPDELSEKELFEKSYEVLQRTHQMMTEQALRRYREMVGKNKTSERLEHIVPAAYHGKIQDLFISDGAPIWGKYDPISNAVELHREYRRGDKDLLDVAATQTFVRGGCVYLVDGKGMPSPDVKATAVFRY